MKKLGLATAVIFSLLFVSCQQEIPEGDPDTLQEVVFNLTTGQGGLLKSDPGCDFDAQYAMITLSIGDETKNLFTPTFVVDGALYTQAIKLLPGSYSLEEFILYNENGTPDDKDDDILLSAAPHAGSTYGNIVPNPLNISFDVSQFSKKEVAVSLMCYEATKIKEFGFVWFKPNMTKMKEMFFFGDFCSPEFQVYKNSLYGAYPKVDMPAIFQINLFQDKDGDGVYETHVGTYNNEEGYINGEFEASVPPLMINYVDLPEVDDYYMMEVSIYELISIDLETGVANFDYKHFEDWYFTNDASIMFKDASYVESTEGLESVGPGLDGVYDFIVGDCVVIEWDIDLDDPDYGDGETTETAFAYNEESSECFLTLGFSRWGWTIELTNTPGAVYNYPIYAGAGQCDLEKGTLVGNLHVEILTNDQAVVTYQMGQGYTLDETQLYVGVEKLPMNGPNSTVAPGQYPYKNGSLNGASSDSYTISIPEGNFHLIAHSVVLGLH